MSFFLGLAFEDVFARAGTRRPGGIRTFPMLALVGGMLYLFDPEHLLPFTAGLLVLGAWLFVYYQGHLRERDEEGQPNVGLMVPLLNVYAFVLGPIALALPHWIAVGATVASVLLFAGRTRLHELARSVEMQEIVTAGEFLVLTGLVLPLLPDAPVTKLTSITPHQAWLALLVVCTLSYASYLIQRYVPRAARGLWMAALGGLYSSTATTVVLARRAGVDRTALRQSRAGITLATGIMYLRILAIMSVFNLALARSLVAPLVALSLIGLAIAGLQYRMDDRVPYGSAEPMAANRNPLELAPAALFATLFVVISVVSTWVITRFGISGIYALAAVVGVTDIDPFVLNLAQGGIAGASRAALAAAILIAASSNNLLKAGYAVSFAGWREAAPSAAALVLLAVAGVAIAIWTGGL